VIARAGARNANRGSSRTGRTLIVMALVLLLGACGSSGSGTSADGASGSDDTANLPVPAVEDGAAPVLPVTVDSADGRSVTVTDISRIVVLQGNIAEVVFALGLGDNVVGRDISATFDEAADIPLVTRAHDVSAESVLSLKPTVVLADTDTGPPEAIDHIRNIGVPLVVFDTATRIDQITYDEALERGLREARHVAAELARVALQEVCGQERDVFAPLAQRRHAQREDLEPVVQVLAEASGLHFLLEVPIRGRHDAHVHLARGGGADGANLAFLQHAQQLGLQRKRHLTHFVQEKRAAVGDLEQSLLLFGGARERAALVPEQLALQ